MKRTREDPDENKRIKSIKYESDDKENIDNTNYIAPMKLKIGVPNKQDIFKEHTKDEDDSGYETEETVAEEDYDVPADYESPKSGYQRYLEMREAQLKSYPEGYETDETVILDEYGNEKMGGKQKHTRKNKRKYEKKIKTAKKLKKKNKTKRRKRSILKKSKTRKQKR